MAKGANPSMFDELPPVMDAATVAGVLGVSVKTVLREASRGRLDSFKVGARVRITRPALVAYVHGETVADGRVK